MVQTFYANIWLRMFIDRPRVRYDGVYISVCQYTRTTNSFAPECLVTYYRYLRFFPNGAVLKYLSLEDPSKVVRLLVANFPDKHAFYGWFDMHDDTVSVTMRERTRPRVQYRMMLQIKNSHKRRHYKLAWKEYSNETEGREGHEEFDLKAFKPYYFSLVRCYVPESPCWDDTCIRK
ncbi:hypothetical protein DFQ30_006055 [Apophysomyces sp. BC1015]|nr:hypothetical protein DFQ30_006055 [Apophysomyces sp. BC1015]